MRFIIDFLKGIAIGAGAIIPGVSSGVICIILGLYEKLINSVLGIFKNFKENIQYLLPIIFGGIVGVVLFGRIMNFLLYKYPIQANYTFIGLIFGSIPSLLKNAEKKEKFKIQYVIYLLCTLVVGFGMVMLERNITNSASVVEYGFIYLFFAGMCMSAGVVVPGVSSTVILMLLGVYSSYINAIANLYIPTLIPIILGLATGSLLCMKIMKTLLEKFYIKTFYSIIGFTIGSVFVLYPGFTFDINGIISILCFMIGFLVTNKFEQRNSHKKLQ